MYKTTLFNLKYRCVSHQCYSGPLGRVFYCIILFLCLHLLCGTTGYAQMQVSGCVVDDQSGEPIPYATIFISAGKGTIANCEGNFSVEAEQSDSLRFSAIGYQTMTLSAEVVPSVVRMQPYTTTLKEIKIMPLNNILKAVVRKLNKDFQQKNKTDAMYFLRQSFSYSQKKDITEGFLSASSSVCLRNMYM